MHAWHKASTPHILALVSGSMMKILLLLSFSSLRGQDGLMPLSSSLSPAFWEPWWSTKEAHQNEGNNVIQSPAVLSCGKSACFLPLARGPWVLRSQVHPPPSLPSRDPWVAGCPFLHLSSRIWPHLVGDSFPWRCCPLSCLLFFPTSCLCSNVTSSMKLPLLTFSPFLSNPLALLKFFQSNYCYLRAYLYLCVHRLSSLLE